MACFIQLFGGPLDGHKVKERNFVQKCVVNL
jgi:hypothetical protein